MRNIIQWIILIYNLEQNVSNEIERRIYIMGFPAVAYYNKDGTGFLGTDTPLTLSAVYTMSEHTVLILLLKLNLTGKFIIPLTFISVHPFCSYYKQTDD
jgi:hypothetical protein